MKNNLKINKTEVRIKKNNKKEKKKEKKRKKEKNNGYLDEFRGEGECAFQESFGDRWVKVNHVERDESAVLFLANCHEPINNG